MEYKRLFFAFDVASPWPEELPPGRLLLEENRHLTIAFLGEVNFDGTLLDQFPPFGMGLCGIFDKPIFLPHHSPNVAAWHIQWLEEGLIPFQKEVVEWLKKRGFHPKEAGEFLSHVTIARQPFTIHEWKEAFAKRPLFLRSFQLYESLGSSRYQVCWSRPLLAPFEEKEHTADIAFIVRGPSLKRIHLHAQMALSFQFPPLVEYFSFEEVSSLDEIVQSLNAIIAKADQEIGAPFKAVSYHGNIVDGEWEMIVDV